MKQYVRITFTPYGSKRRRSCWAVKGAETGGVATYTVCDSSGNVKKGQYKGGTLVEQMEVIIAAPFEVVERPARMNNHYAELEIDEGQKEQMPDPYRRMWDTETEERGIRFDATADTSEHSIWEDPDPKSILDCQPDTEENP
jgi:endoglucanase Acf2